MVRRIILLFASLFPVMAVAQSQQVRTIYINYNKEKGPLNTAFKTCVGAGRANEGLRADWQQQLAIARKECGFKYIRMHGLLTDDMAVYREDAKGNPEYNYQYVDALYDYIVSIGMKPFVELGFMPSALASGSKTIFWWRGNVTQPKDYDKWAALIQNLTRHFTERYGRDEVKTWYFEVWNEPNLKDGFWVGSRDDYFKLYRYSAEAVKSVDKDYKVGGPATAGAAWVPEMIQFCSKNSVPIDFISTHAYGVKQGYLDEYGSTGTVLDKNPAAISGDIINSRKQIQASAIPGLELHYTEWSASYTPADPIHDSYHEAAYILNKIKQTGGAANSMSYWTFTDIFEEAGPRFTPFHGGFGLMNIEGIKKPAYYAYMFMNKLGNTELLNADSSSWACKDKKGGLQVLAWDYTYTLPDSVNNQAYYVRDLPAKSKGMVRLLISGIPQGNYRLEVSQIGYKSNDVYSTYLTMNKPDQLTKNQVEILKGQNDGQPKEKKNVTIDSSGKFSIELPLRENDVYLFNLIKK
ncbi:MAG: GH39 family glycosyl hydrolase [Mucilaginibacter sp.]